MNQIMNIQNAEQAAPEILQQVGLLTRQLRDVLEQLGVMPGLQEAADGLPDARSRLNYIADKTADAANKVLNLVDAAKAQHQQIVAETQHLADAVTADPVRAVASGAVLNFVGSMEARTTDIDAKLTDIMMAQDFHDLTGQVIAKVVVLAVALEASLGKLMAQVGPTGPADAKAVAAPRRELNGPQVGVEASADVVADQSEVDDLLASLGL